MLLSGPILRRTDKSSAHIWLATSDAADIRINIYHKANLDIPIANSASEVSKTDRIKVGENLYVHLIKVVPDNNDGFPLDELLLYNLWINNQDLTALGLIGKSKSAINYPGLPLPSFYIASEFNNFLFASCRKPHAYEFVNDGNPDRLAAGDEVIAKSPKNCKKRPSALFLAGDQIYADDVAMPMLDNIQRAAKEHIGKEEVIYSAIDSSKTIKPSTFLIRGRKDFITDTGNVGFTTGKGHNHLMTFGEYASMYLNIFSPMDKSKLANWNKVKDAVLHDEDTEIDDDENIFNVEIKYIRELNEVKYFNTTLHKVRRLLANIPTYMIFDDHDVTDDWNIDQKWQNNVNNSHFGSTIVSNALAAYWVFQGWGNAPDQFDENFIATITNHLNSDSYNDQDQKSFQDALAETNWHYSVPYDKPVIVLDTRTRRHFDSASEPAQLLDKKSFEWFTNEWDKITKSLGLDAQDTSLILVSPTPVYGFIPIEAGQSFLKKIGLSNASLDIESWSANAKGLETFQAKISETMIPKWCLILSGDVHYSFARQINLASNKVPTGVDIWQLTSSPLKNKSTHHFVFSLLRKFEKLLTKETNYIKPSIGNMGYIASANNIGFVKIDKNEFHLIASNHTFQIYPIL